MLKSGSVAILAREVFFCFILLFLNVAPAMSASDCPVCLHECGETDHVFRWHCGHVAHFACIVGSYPIKCPICRSDWTLQDTRVAELCLQRLQHYRPMFCPQTPPLSPHTPPLLHPGLADRPEHAPTDFAPLCCPHLGAPPSFAPILDQRCMHFHALRSDGGCYEDSWQCNGCGITFTRDAIFAQIGNPFTRERFELSTTWADDVVH